MAAEKSVKLANLEVEIFQIGLSFHRGFSSAPHQVAYSVPWIPAARFVCYALSNSFDRRNLTHENFQNLKGLLPVRPEQLLFRSVFKPSQTSKMEVIAKIVKCF